MGGKMFWLGLLLASAGTAVGSAQSRQSDIVVHEWGTFLTMQGSDGISLDGMYHEEHALPSFVHSRSRDQLKLRSAFVKGETPVIYFYTERKQSVNVRVDFPSGLWTQWYPQAMLVGPQFAQAGSPPKLRNGHIVWQAEVIPAAAAPPQGVPPIEKDALWNIARQVDAAYVRTSDSTRGGKIGADRFLFYRGLGEAPLPLSMTSEDGGTLSCAGSSQALRHLFVLRVENGRGAYRYLPELAPRQTLTGVVPAMPDARPLSEFTRRISDDLAARLGEAGLYPKEARAMVNTWRQSYFQTPGTRVLFILPQSWTDRYIPMRLDPRPRQLVRVMVGRLETLTPERERLAENAVRDLASPDAAARRKAFAYLREQGRYVEPIVRRVRQATKDEKVRLLCDRLLLADFVTELRAAAQPADPSHLADNPIHVRAQLAVLLREVGHAEEAKTEAAEVVAALRRMPEPRTTESKARHYFRAHARAMEGMGDDPAAIQSYARFIRFGSQVRNGGQCVGCHEMSEGPRSMAWFRDWWAGRRFAELSLREGAPGGAIAAHERTLASAAGDTAARMMLAYLYEAQGQKEKAARMWAAIDPGGARVPVAVNPRATGSD
jgi:hypothetical protein